MLRCYIPPEKFGCQVPNWTHKYTYTLPMMVPQCMDEWNILNTFNILYMGPNIREKISQCKLTWTDTCH